MAAVWMRARAELRARWRAWLALAVLTGVFAGGVMALAGGARRTQSAYPRFLETTNAADIWVPNLPFGQIWAQFDFDELARHPLVAESARARLAFGEEDGAEIGIVGADPALWRSLNAATVLEGRLPSEGEPHEISLPFPMAQEFAVDVGDRVTWPFASNGPPVEVTLDVVGIHAAAGDFPPVGDTLNAVGTQAFFERYGDSVFGFDVLVVRLVEGPAGVPEFRSLLGQLGGGKVVFTTNIAEQTEDVQGSIGLQVTALWLLALIAGVSVTLVLGQAIARQSFLDADDDPRLRALGMSGADLFAVAIARGALVALASMAIAVALAVGLSPLTPRGSARIAEPHPGVAFDATVIGIGVAALLVVIVSITVAAGLRRVRRPVLAEGRQRPSAVARAFARARPATVTGVRFALEPGGGTSAVPVRTTILSVALGIATLIGTLVFAGNVDHLLATPRLYGEVWDHAFGVAQAIDEDFPDATPIAEDMRARDDLAAVAVGSRGVPIELDSIAAHGLAIDQLKDTIGPPILEGRLPVNEREIVAGPATLRRIGKDVGDTVSLSIQGSEGVSEGVEVTIVGVGVLLPLGASARFGDGVFLTYRLLNTVGEKSPQLRGIVPPPDEVYVVYAEGVDPAEVEADIRSTYRPGSRRGLETSLGPDFPGIDAADIVSFGRVRAMPFVLAGMLAALAVATMVHALVSGVRRRRHELAVLRTLGFVRRQVRATVRWQSTTLAVATFALALPAGIALGRWGWLLFARANGVVGEVVVPAHVLLVGPAALVVALLAAMLPACVAARVRPAVVLRSE